MKPFSLKHAIKVLVADIDGCLVAVRHASFDLNRVAEIAALNRNSAVDPVVPALTILSGRPQPYVDALMQVFDIRQPAIFENGAGLATRFPYRSRLEPDVERGLADLKKLESILAGQSDIALQLGKVASLSVFPLAEADGITFIEARLAELITRHDLKLHIDPSHVCVNVLVPGIDKALGVAWLAEVLGIKTSEMAGIGDSVGDIGWLERCALSCAPVNADERVKKMVSYVSAKRDIEATLEFYHLIIESNRYFLEGAHLEATR